VTLQRRLRIFGAGLPAGVQLAEGRK